MPSTNHNHLDTAKSIGSRLIVAPLLLAALFLAACGSDGGTGDDTDGSAAGAANAEAGLTAVQLEHGLGPIAPFDPGPIDAALAERGADIFKMKCTSCHKMEGRYVGPPLGDITETRSPAYVMNMILNPQEMITAHPTAKKVFAEYLTPMPNQSLSEDDARAVLEYLRTQ
jgi:cytochrome c551/c552/predicted small secreted protein